MQSERPRSAAAETRPEVLQLCRAAFATLYPCSGERRLRELLLRIFVLGGRGSPLKERHLKA